MDDDVDTFQKWEKLYSTKAWNKRTTGQNLKVNIFRAVKLPASLLGLTGIPKMKQKWSTTVARFASNHDHPAVTVLK